MHHSVLLVVTAALAAATAAVPPASAVNVLGCSVTQDDVGSTSCTYLALTTTGQLELSNADGSVSASVVCPSGGSASRTTEGTSSYPQSLGEFCTVTASVFTADGIVTASATNVI